MCRGSSPHRPTSKLEVAGPSGNKELSTGFRSQADLFVEMDNEISDQTWEFPPSTLARILSSKRPKSGVKITEEPPPLDQYSCKVDSVAFQNALEDVLQRLILNPYQTSGVGEGETAAYPTLAEFLTRCMTECHNSLDEQRFTRDRWNCDLRFIVARPLAKAAGVEGASALKPDIAGGVGISVQDNLFWDPPEDKPDLRITLPVEVKKDWRKMVVQASTYSRCLFSADRPRSFALTLAFNQNSSGLRFLVFHRGGLTASELCDISSVVGLKDTLRPFLALASWRTPVDAGFIACCNKDGYLLPADQTGQRPISARAIFTLSNPACIRGRATDVSLLSLGSGTPPANLPPPPLPGSLSPLLSNPLPPPPERPPTIALSSTTRKRPKPAVTTIILRRSPRIKAGKATDQQVGAAFCQS